MTSQSPSRPLIRPHADFIEPVPAGPPIFGGAPHGTPSSPETPPTTPPSGPGDDGKARLRRNLAIMLIAGTSALAIAFGGAALMNAFFTAQASVSGQKVTTGTVNVSATTAATSAPIAVTGLLPGDSAETRIMVRNTGTEPVYLNFSLPASQTNDPALSGTIEASITFGTSAGPAITRSLTAWQSGHYQLAAPLAPGAETPIVLKVALPDTTTNQALQGKSAEFAAHVSAVQVKNTPVPKGNLWVGN